ncbi:PREDICTED: uncharacterized protein LOC109129474 [Camelina sativa]|uniref:Uncharacterized protein LOC109129474 n=1 Tax=Camelina sativa TaxID=90675 RepID=A0ABM1R2P2_CAMSA|nr:PREDICTED: uncharacterized protein LOC109129474 [Camelina sativa]
MSNCKPCLTPVDTHNKLAEDDGPPVVDLTLYCGLAGALQYLTFTRPDISFVVQQGTLDHRLHFYKNSPPSLTAYSDAAYVSLNSDDSLTAYSDADWAGCPST